MKSFFLILSLAFVVSGTSYFLATKQGRRSRHTLLGLTAATLLAILCLEAYMALEKGQTFPAGIIGKTMQAFSLDADYDELFDVSLTQTQGSGSENSGRQNGEGKSERESPDAEAAAGQDDASKQPSGHHELHILLQLYKWILYSAAPVLGGAVIYDVIAGVSPYLQLFFRRRRTLYVFSALNRKSLCLAGSIAEDTEKSGRPVLVFADCPVSGESGGDAELRRFAKEIKAICLPDKLANCRGLDRAGQCVFFLLACDAGGELDEIRNLCTLWELLAVKTHCWPKKRGCRIFSFSNDAAVIDSIRACKKDYEEQWKEEGAERITLHVVREHVRCAYTLMDQHPLFAGLEEKRPGEPLRVLIVGSTPLARELLKTVFWCGQILDHPLCLAAADAREDAGCDAESLLNGECPELIKSCSPGDDSLRISFDGDCAEPYASLCFIEDSRQERLSPAFLTKARKNRIGAGESFQLSNFDYFILADEKDNDNMELADHLWRGLTYLKRNGAAAGTKTIAVAVENEALFDVESLHCEDLREQESSVNVFPFGSIAERYHWEKAIAGGALARTPEQTVNNALHGLPGMPATMDEIYDEWSTLARHVHLPYRVFSALQRAERAEKPRERLAAALRDKLAYCEAIEKDARLRERLAWLEHRRWNAFMRTEGFQRPPQLEAKLRELADGACTDDGKSLSLYAYKNIPARLHPNLVESFCGKNETEQDLLDAATRMRQHVDRLVGKDNISGDLKKYDYPDEKYGPRLSREEILACLGDADPTAEGFELDKAWEKLEKQYPELKTCEDPNRPGRYFAGRTAPLLDRHTV